MSKDVRCDDCGTRLAVVEIQQFKHLCYGCYDRRYRSVAPPIPPARTVSIRRGRV